MGTAEYAAHRQCSDSYIRRLRRKGLVIACPHGDIDVAATDRSLDENLHPVRGGDRTAPPADPGEVSASAAAPSPAHGLPPLPGDPQVPSVNEAVRRERLARARLAELELGELSEKLIRKQPAQRATVTLVRHAIGQMRLMGSRLRGQLAATSDPRKIELMINADIDIICEEMRKAAGLVAVAVSTEDEPEREAA